MAKTIEYKHYDEKNPAEWPEIQGSTKRARERQGKPLLIRWHEDGFLKLSHLKAAGQIRRAYELITRDVRLTTPSLSRVAGTHLDTQHWTESQLECVQIYAMWVEQLIERKIPSGKILDVVVDEKPLRKMKAQGPYYSELKDVIKRGLNIYGKLVADIGAGKKILK